MPTRLDLIAYANVPLVETIDVGLNLSGYRGTLQVRLYPAASGDPLIDLGPAHHGLEGVSVDDAGDVTIRVNDATLASVYDTLIATSQREAGDAIGLQYDLVLTPLLGDETLHFYGEFQLRGGVTRSPAPVPRLAALGHSFVNYNHFVGGDGSYAQTLGHGQIVMAQALNPRFEFIIWADISDGAPYWKGANLGIGGDTSAMALDRLDELEALDADIWVINLGINDIRGSIPPATAMANIQTIAAAGLARNKQVVIANVTPVAVAAEGVGTWGLGDPKRTAIADLNALIAAYCTATAGVTLWDAWSAYDDGSGLPITGYIEDGIHPSQLGALQAGGPSLNLALDQIIDNKASAIPTGTNLYSHGNMDGTGGTPGSGVTGTVATDWTLNNTTGTGGGHATAVGSQANGHQRFVITATATGDDYEIFMLSRQTGGCTVTPGTWVQGWADVELSAWDGWRYVIFRSSLVFGLDYAAFDGTASLETAETTRLRIVTPPFLVPEGTTSVSPIMPIVIDGKANGAGTIDIRQLGMAVVDDPRPGYGF